MRHIWKNYILTRPRTSEKKHFPTLTFQEPIYCIRFCCHGSLMHALRVTLSFFSCSQRLLVPRYQNTLVKLKKMVPKPEADLSPRICVINSLPTSQWVMRFACGLLQLKNTGFFISNSGNMSLVLSSEWSQRYTSRKRYFIDLYPRTPPDNFKLVQLQNNTFDCKILFIIAFITSLNERITFLADLTEPHLHL